MSTLKLSIIQSDLKWHDPAANREQFTSALESIGEPTDLAILPEMFATGFTMDAANNAEKMDGKTVQWMADMASKTGASVCGSLIIEDAGEFYNRFICVSPTGELTHYDKRHLFCLAGEDKHFAAGSSRTTFSMNGFRICPLICYDLRFPVWSRNNDSYDLLIFVANWPSPRHFAWQTLLRARAIENLSFVAGVNRAGKDGNGLPYLGGSAVIDYLGADLVNLGDAVGVATTTLDRQALVAFRERFAFDKDADDFDLT